MESALRANPQDVREYEKQLKDFLLGGAGRGMIETIRHGLQDDGYAVSISKLCQWFDVR